jgi:hypothetical protein
MPDSWKEPEWAKNPWTLRGQLYRLSHACGGLGGGGVDVLVIVYKSRGNAYLQTPGMKQLNN